MKNIFTTGLAWDRLHFSVDYFSNKHSRFWQLIITRTFIFPFTFLVYWQKIISFFFYHERNHDRVLTITIQNNVRIHIFRHNMAYSWTVKAHIKILDTHIESSIFRIFMIIQLIPQLWSPFARCKRPATSPRLTAPRVTKLNKS